jgi:hypothetical protein
MTTYRSSQTKSKASKIFAQFVNRIAAVPRPSIWQVALLCLAVFTALLYCFGPSSPSTSSTMTAMHESSMPANNMHYADGTMLMQHRNGASSAAAAAAASDTRPGDVKEVDRPTVSDTRCWWSADATVYVGSHSPYASGGSEALHQLHHALVQVGFDSIFVGSFIEEFRTPASNPGAFPTHIRQADFLFRGEGDLKHWSAYENDFRHGGGRLGVYFLGQIDERPDRLIFEDHVGLCLNGYFRDMYGCAVNAVANTPMGDEFFRAALDVERHPPMRDDIIIIDNDFEFNTEVLAISKRPGVRFVVLKDMTRDQVLDLYARAKIMVDLYMPGAERAGYEASLLGAVVIVGNNGCGRSHSCVPVPSEYRIDWHDWESLNHQLEFILDHFDEAKADMAALRQHSLTIRDTYASDVFRVFHANLHIVTTAMNQADMEYVVPFCLSAFMLYPSVTIEILIPQDLMYFFLFQQSRALHEIRKFGFVSSAGLTFTPIPSNMASVGRNIMYKRGMYTTKRAFTLFSHSPAHLVLGQRMMVSMVELMQLKGSKTWSGIMNTYAAVVYEAGDKNRHVMVHTSAWEAMELSRCSANELVSDKQVQHCQEELSLLTERMRTSARILTNTRVATYFDWSSVLVPIHRLSKMQHCDTKSDAIDLKLRCLTKAERVHVVHFYRIQKHVAWKAAAFYFSKRFRDAIDNLSFHAGLLAQQQNSSPQSKAKPPGAATVDLIGTVLADDNPFNHVKGTYRHCRTVAIT